jgi:hypothetical protein
VFQAGRRDRKVIAGLFRVGAPVEALPCYEVYAAVDAKNGKDWVENEVIPLVEDRADWAKAVARAARWRSTVSGRFFDAITTRFCGRSQLTVWKRPSAARDYHSGVIRRIRVDQRRPLSTRQRRL